MKRLADFDLAAAPTIDATVVATLASCAFVERGDPVVFLGDSGTGKTHLLVGTGVAACEQGRSVRYVTAAQLVNELAEAADERRLSRIVARYGRVELLCLDELGYVHLDARGSELLFQILTEREERASVAVASNLPFSEWGPDHSRSPVGGGGGRPAHLPGSDHRDRHRQLQAANQPRHPFEKERLRAGSAAPFTHRGSPSGLYGPYSACFSAGSDNRAGWGQIR